MPRNREAISTIKGYYFQFDYFILQLLYLQNDESTVCIEGVEDVDVITRERTEAVQCKYCEATKCIPSKVAKAVRPMLKHFAEHKAEAYRYKVYGHYSSGQDAIPDAYDVQYMKEHFFTYEEKGSNHVLHEELKLSDDDLREFWKRLELQLDANSYEEQIEEIISQLMLVLHCREFEARFFYYNNALGFIKDIAVRKEKEERTVSRKQFLESVGRKKELFDEWYIEFIGFTKFYKEARKQYFTDVNISPAHRFFLIDCDDKVTDDQLADMIMTISEKWSKTSSREPNPFCPYVYLQGISEDRLLNVKRMLTENKCYFWDGYDYKGAEFSPQSLSKSIKEFRGIKVKIINTIDQIEIVIKECKSSKKVFEFYLRSSFFERKSYVGYAFQIQNTADILKIV